MEHNGQGRAAYIQSILYSPGLAGHWGPMDEAVDSLPQNEAHQQCHGPKWTCNFLLNKNFFLLILNLTTGTKKRLF